MLDNHRSHRTLACVLLFALISVVLVGVNWHMIHAAGNEVADFAANSLLIQDAKRLHLIYGHYSRVGFNHPGPAILYVQAFGELLFHDWLHLTPAPFGGQIIASLLYNAAWMALIFALARRTAGTLQALLFLAVFVLVALCIDPANVNGMWFPHMYFFPYAAMLLSIAPLAYGRADTLKALAVTSGFLLNGHASFIPMLGVILIVMVAANWLMSRRDRAQRILSLAWLRTHRRPLLISIGILFLFLVPLLLATIKDFPGPLYDYVYYGRQNKGNPWPAAAQFVLNYWGTGKMLAHGLALALVVAVLMLTSRPAQAEAGQAPRDVVRSMRGLGIALIASTVSLLYYAKAGIDDLSQVYVALFYYAVPALCVAIVALFVCRAVPAARRRQVAGVATAIVLACSWHWLGQEPSYTYNYAQTEVAGLYAQLRALPGSGRIVLDLENKDPYSWTYVWGNTLALEAYAKRRHDDFFCINQQWHISFTRAAKCRPEEVAANRRYEVHLGDSPDAALGEPDVDADRLAFYREGVARRPLARVYISVKEHPDDFKRMLGKGWSGIEGDFAWSDGPVARIDLPADPSRGKTIALDMGAFVPTMGLHHSAQAFVDGRLAGQAEWGVDAPRHRFAIDLGPDPGAAKHIELRISNPVTPKQFGIGEDTRLLGLSLYGIVQATPANEAGL